MHADGASLFFLAVYIHIFRGLYYGSYKAPRELLWILGVVIYLLMMATAFLGYVLPWGQMSFWGATVITNLFSAHPGGRRPDRHLAVGRLRGRQPDAQPLLLAALPAAVHHRRRWWRCTSGRCTCRATTTRSASTAKGPQDTVPFHPYYTVKDGFAIIAVPDHLRGRSCSSCPNCAGRCRQLHPGQPAGDAAADRAGMVPPAVLRDPARRSRTSWCGVLTMFGSIALLFVLPWLDTCRVRSCAFRPIYKWFVFVLVIDVLVLGYCGAHPPEGWLDRDRCRAPRPRSTTSSTS